MRNLKTKKHLQQFQIYFYLCETLKTTKTETNADFRLIMRNPEDHKTTATNGDLLLIMRNLKTKKQLQQMLIYF